VEGISIVEDKAVMNDLCFGCGCCANACPYNAINLTVSPDSKVLEELRSRVESRTRID
jgi:Fe-S-cluster-containing hydrogenase component 2